MTIEEMKKELRGFIGSDGKICGMPTKTKRELMVAAIVASAVQPDRAYTEKEINELILSQISFGDYCTVRRDLIDFGFMSRKENCTEYRLVTKKPNLSAYNLVID